MTFNFKEAFKGFNEATPDGKHPKINEAMDPPKYNGKDGTYEYTILETEGGKSDQTKSLYLKVVVKIDNCDNGRFKPGTEAVFMFHGLTDAQDWMRDLGMGNCKDFLAPALSSRFGIEITPHQPDVEGDSWEELLAECSRGEMTNEAPSTFLAGARGRVTVFTDISQGRRNGGTPKKFARCSYVTLPKAEEAAA